MKNKWIAEFERNEQDFPQLVSQDLFKDWDISSHPEWRADFDLLLATINFYAGDPLQLAKRFLERSKTVCDRIIKEEKWSSPKCSDAMPLIRGMTYRLRAYLHVFYHGQFDSIALTQASQDYEEWCIVYLKGYWIDDSIQHNYMTAILLAIFAEDYPRAQRLIQKKRKYHFHAEFLEILESIVNRSLALSLSHAEDSFKKWMGYFNRIRDPQYQPGEFSELALRRLELGFIHEKFYGGSRGRLEWGSVMEIIST